MIDYAMTCATRAVKLLLAVVSSFKLLTTECSRTILPYQFTSITMIVPARVGTVISRTARDACGYPRRFSCIIFRCHCACPSARIYADNTTSRTVFTRFMSMLTSNCDREIIFSKRSSVLHLQ